MKIQIRYALFLAILFAACKKEIIEPLPPAPAMRTAGTEAVVTLSENFESGTKAAYAAGNVTLSSGSWNLSDALIGNLAADAKSGAQSVRIRNTGSLTMNFNGSGATIVTIRHAVYGSDGNSTWQLWISTNGGSSYTQTGSTITSSGASLQTATFNTRCDSGPSVRIGWPLPCLILSQEMAEGPKKKTKSSAVAVAPPARKVM